MRIIGFSFKKMNAERKKEIKGDLKISSNLAIDDLEKEDLEIAGEVLKFSYTYTIKYDPEYAEIVFKGTVLVSINNVKEILKNWKKKKMSDEIRVPVFNFVMSKCNLKALQLEEEFNLPPHIPLPQLRRQAEQQAQGGKANYAG